MAYPSSGACTPTCSPKETPSRWVTWRCESSGVKEMERWFGQPAKTAVELLPLGGLPQEQASSATELFTSHLPGWERLDFRVHSRGRWRASPTFCACGRNPSDVAGREKWARQPPCMNQEKVDFSGHYTALYQQLCHRKWTI